MRPIVDPQFGATLHQLRLQRGLSLRDLAAAAYVSSSTLHDYETGRRRPSLETARQVDTALTAGGLLANLVRDPAADLEPEAGDRLTYATTHPRRTDPAAIDALAGLLAAQRRIEDTLGASAVIGSAGAQLDVVMKLAAEAHDDLRPALIHLAAQWAQFGGWLHLAIDDRPGSQRWSTRALEWATELGDRDLSGTVLSFRGLLAEDQREIGTMIGVSRAAAEDPAVHISQRADDFYQVARGLARVGDQKAAAVALAHGDDAAAEAVSATGPTPPWHYYRTRAFFQMEAGRAVAVRARAEPKQATRAVELLTDGLAGLPADSRTSDWVGSYLVDLAASHWAAGDRDPAELALRQARRIAADTRSPRLPRQVTSAVRALSAVR